MIKFIPLMMIFLLSIVGAFGALGDILQSYDISTTDLWVGGIESMFQVGDEWHVLSINTSNAFIGVFDSNFNPINGSGALEHFFEPDFIFNTDGAYNGSHYFLRQPNIGVYYVYDSDFNFVQNITPIVNGDAIAWNGSTFIGSQGNDLKDLGTDLQSNILIAAGIIDDTGGLSQSGGILFVGGAQGGDTNLTSYNTSNAYTEINKFTTTGFMAAVASNASNVIFGVLGSPFQFLDNDLNLISTPSTSAGVGANDARGLTFDGTSFWILDRSLNKWWKYDTNFLVTGSVDISSSGSNWRGGTAIGNDLYAYNQDDATVYVYSTSGGLTNSFGISPLPEGGNSQIRGLSSNGTHILLNNQLGNGNGANIGVFEADGTYIENITLTAATGLSKSVIQSNIDTASTDIISIGGDPVATHGYLLRYDNQGSLLTAINFSTLSIDATFPYGMDYIPSTNRLFLLPRFITVTESNPNLVYELDGGTLNIALSTPSAITDGVTLDNFDQVGVSFIRMMVALFIVIGIGAAFRSSFK